MGLFGCATRLQHMWGWFTSLPEYSAGPLLLASPARVWWWSRGDSNPRLPPCKGGALPTELRPQCPRRSLPHGRRRRSILQATELRPVVPAPQSTSRPAGGAQFSRQLSYGPVSWSLVQPFVRGRPARSPGRTSNQGPTTRQVVVGHGGLEPPTSVLSGPRSNQLS